MLIAKGHYSETADMIEVEDLSKKKKPLVMNTVQTQEQKKMKNHIGNRAPNQQADNSPEEGNTKMPKRQNKKSYILTTKTRNPMVLFVFVKF